MFENIHTLSTSSLQSDPTTLLKIVQAYAEAVSKGELKDKLERANDVFVFCCCLFVWPEEANLIN